MITQLDDKITHRQVDHFYIDMNGILYLVKEQFQQSHHHHHHRTQHTTQQTQQHDSQSENSDSAENLEYDFIFQVFLYVEELVYRVSPTKTLMIAVDGVSPCAKWQQQRQRRWKRYVRSLSSSPSASSPTSESHASKGAVHVDHHHCTHDHHDHEHEHDHHCTHGHGHEHDHEHHSERVEAEEEEAEDSEKLSFSFSPGTQLMSDINKHLQYFVRRKIQDDERWRRIQRIILSDASVPGEGEHKIMDYIRSERSRKKSKHDDDDGHHHHHDNKDNSKSGNFDDNDLHCMYGMDSDLIMLALSTHIPNFILLREHVVISTPFKNRSGGGRNRIKRQKMMSKQFKQSQKVLEKRRFQILDVGVLRRFIDHEFSDVAIELDTSVVEYSVERLIDDFVFMLFLCGNDFLPNLPTLDIGEGALDYFFSIYKAILPELGGYIVDVSTVDHRPQLSNLIHVDRFIQYLQALSQYEYVVMDKRLSKDASFKYRLKQIRMLREKSQPTARTSNIGGGDIGGSGSGGAPSSSSSNSSSNGASSSSSPSASSSGGQVSSTAPSPSSSNASATANYKLLFSAHNENLKNLMTAINTAGASVVNCKGDLKRLIMAGSLLSNSVTSQSLLTDSTCSLVSDVDEQMIIRIPFKKPVTLNSILLFSTDSSPRTIKLFVDRMEVDFSNVESFVPSQQITLPDVPQQLTYRQLEHRLNPLKFDTVNHLTIYVQDNVSDSRQTKITRLGLFGQVIDLSKRTPPGQKGRPVKDLTKILSDYRKAHDHAHDHGDKHQHQRQHRPGNVCEKECSHEHDANELRPKESKRPVELSPDDKYTLLPPPNDLSKFSRFNVFPYCMTLNLNHQYLTIDVNEWKRRYYSIKMNIETEEGKQRLVRHYCEGLCFVLLYYYMGLPSWTWYYPYHYAPPVSDLVRFGKGVFTGDQPIQFTMDHPLEPLQQLLAILPPTASALLPRPYRSLITDASSPIRPLFHSGAATGAGTEMAIDDTESTSKWEAIIRVPFPDPQRIRQATTAMVLEEVEQQRNGSGSVLVMAYDPSVTVDIYRSTLPGMLDDIHDCHTRVEHVPQEELPVHLRCHGSSNSSVNGGTTVLCTFTSSANNKQQ